MEVDLDNPQIDMNLICPQPRPQRSKIKIDHNSVIFEAIISFIACILILLPANEHNRLPLDPWEPPPYTSFIFMIKSNFIFIILPCGCSS